jgi:glutamine synthetase
MSEFDPAAWRAKNPELGYVQAGVVDLNGQFRGKRMPMENFDKVMTDGFRMPSSLMGVDIWGRDAEESALVFASGDGDGVVMPTERGPILQSLGSTQNALVQCVLFNEDGTPFVADPRQALAMVEDRYKQAGLDIIVATELEFYITNPDEIYATAQNSNRLATEYNMVSLDELDAFEPFISDIYAECERQNVPADAAISENGTGQFEINLKHVKGALHAADDAILFKRIVKTAARKHGLCATFMAKPFGDRSGSGLHVHFSLLNEAGENIFSGNGEKGSDILHHAVAGLLDAMPASMAVFAPHANSYRRFAPHSHAPSSIAWGYENRTTAIRIPGGPDAARRIEHRVSGADANPYLVLAAILGAALNGMESGNSPEPATKGDAYNADLESLPIQWAWALAEFEKSTSLDGVFDPLLKQAFLDAKNQELARFVTDVSALEYRTYLDHA